MSLIQREIKEIGKAERRIRGKIPFKGILAAILSLSLCIITIIVLVAVSINGSVTVHKTMISLGGDASFNVEVKNVTQVVELVLADSHIHPPSTSTSTIISTSTTTIQPKLRTYGTIHDASLTWYDPETGVGSRPSGNDIGACGR